MTAQNQYSWRREREGLGVWEHRGKVALVGRGHSQTAEHWDGVSMDKTLGAYAMIAAQNAIKDAGTCCLGQVGSGRLFASTSALADQCGRGGDP